MLEPVSSRLKASSWSQGFGARFGAQGRQHGDQVAHRAQRLLGPAAEVEVVDVVGDQAVGEAEAWPGCR